MLFEYVIMTNHIHLIAQAKKGYKLSQIISDFKKHTTREILKLLPKDNRRYLSSVIQSSQSKKKGYTDQIWQRENCPKLIESEEFLLQKIEYMHLNPVKKGYVEKAEDWLYSSARNRMLNDHSVCRVDDWE